MYFQAKTWILKPLEEKKTKTILTLALMVISLTWLELNKKNRAEGEWDYFR